MRHVATVFLYVLCLPLVALADSYGGDLLGGDRDLSGFRSLFSNIAYGVGSRFGYAPGEVTLVLLLWVCAAVAVLTLFFLHFLRTKGLSTTLRRAVFFLSSIAFIEGFGTAIAPVTINASLVHTIAGTVLVVISAVLMRTTWPHRD